MKKLDTFHHRYICNILGISNQQQWTEKITTAEIRGRWGTKKQWLIRSRNGGWIGWAMLHAFLIAEIIFLGVDFFSNILIVGPGKDFVRQRLEGNENWRGQVDRRGYQVQK